MMSSKTLHFGGQAFFPGAQLCYGNIGSYRRPVDLLTYQNEYTSTVSSYLAFGNIPQVKLVPSLNSLVFKWKDAISKLKKDTMIQFSRYCLKNQTKIEKLPDHNV